MHLSCLGGEIVPHENSFDFAVAVVTANGEAKEEETPGFLVGSDLEQSSVTNLCNKLADGKSGLHVLLQLAKLSMQGLCLVAGGTVQALVVLEA